MTANMPALERLLGQVFDGFREDLRESIPPAEYEQRRHDFVFHMLDWTEDLDDLSRLYHSPDGQDVDSATVYFIGFLSHVIPHLNTAGRLLLDDVPDPFASDWPATPAGRSSEGQP